MPKKNKILLKISELAKKAGVSVPTIKFYINQGLLPRPVKTGRTMAYYDESYVKRIAVIKKLQRERYLPLEVIKRMMNAGDSFDDDIEFGKAAFKTNKSLSKKTPASEADAAKITGFPIEKIRILEKEGFLNPATGGGGKIYDPYDIEVIEIFLRREKFGVPFEHSINILRAYRDNLDCAVREDLRLFASSFLGDVSTRQAVKLMTEADETIDKYLFLSRHRMIRDYGVAALRRLNDISGELSLLNIFPIEGKDMPALPSSSEDGASSPALLRALFAGDYKAVIKTIGNEGGVIANSDFQAAAILAMLLSGDIDGALDAASMIAPEPSTRPYINSVAALSCVFGLAKASGFSRPIYLARRALEYLKRVEAFEDKSGLDYIFSRYVCGALYVMFPDFFNTVETGIAILDELCEMLTGRDFGANNFPEWAKRTIRYEVFPAMEIRGRRFLAEGKIKVCDFAGARESLSRLIKISDPSSDFSRWANIRMLEIERR